jgi:hypothetical protein
MTKVKPQRIKANNSPVAGQVPKFVDDETFERWEGGTGGSWGNIVFVSDNFPTMPIESDTITHNLNVSQADVESGRYQVKITGTQAWEWLIINNLHVNVSYEQSVWSASDPLSWKANRQANTLKVYIGSGGTLTNVRIIIEDLRLMTGGLGSGAGQTVYISPAQDVDWTIGEVLSITHNLWITENDVLVWRYKLLFTFNQWTVQWINRQDLDWWLWTTEKPERHIWSSADPTTLYTFSRQTNTLKAASWWWNWLYSVRVHIIDTFVTNAKAGVIDEAYGPTRQGRTTEAPSMNVVYDKMESMENSFSMNTDVLVFIKKYNWCYRSSNIYT